MGRTYIKDEHGNNVKGDDGGSLFYSDDDGDSPKDTDQTVYEQSRSIGEGDSKIDKSWNPSKGTFNK